MIPFFLIAAAATGVPPSIDHAPVSCLIADRHPLIEARLTPADAVARGRVSFRAQGTPYWYYVELRPAGTGGRFSAALPRPKPATTAVEYYVEITAADFETQRTPETIARVAPQCDGSAPAMATMTVAVGSLTAGAPSLPPGFSSVGVVSLGAATAGGGVPLLAFGGAAAAAGVGAALALDGGGETCPVASSTFHEIALACEGINREARAGCALGFQVGVGRWATAGEMQAALAGHRAVIAVDGQELPVTNEGPTLHTGGGEAPGLGDRARATWTATPGAHVVTGFWTVHPDAVSRCAFSVAD